MFTCGILVCSHVTIYMLGFEVSCTKYCYRVRLVESLYRWIYLIYKWNPFTWNRFSSCIRQTEDGFDNIEQFNR